MQSQVSKVSDTAPKNARCAHSQCERGFAARLLTHTTDSGRVWTGFRDRCPGSDAGLVGVGASGHGHGTHWLTCLVPHTTHFSNSTPSAIHGEGRDRDRSQGIQGRRFHRACESLPFEVLDFPFVLFRRCTRCEGPEISSFPGFGVPLAGVQAVLACRKFPDHFPALLASPTGLRQRDFSVPFTGLAQCQQNPRRHPR